MDRSTSRWITVGGESASEAARNSTPAPHETVVRVVPAQTVGAWHVELAARQEVVLDGPGRDHDSKTTNRSVSEPTSNGPPPRRRYELIGATVLLLIAVSLIAVNYASANAWRDRATALERELDRQEAQRVAAQSKLERSEDDVLELEGRVADLAGRLAAKKDTATGGS